MRKWEGSNFSCQSNQSQYFETGAHTFSIVWHNDNGGAKVHMRQSRCAHGQRGNSLSSASLSLLIRKDSIMHETLHNLGFKWIYEVLSNSIVLKPLCYADLGQQRKLNLFSCFWESFHCCISIKATTMRNNPSMLNLEFENIVTIQLSTTNYITLFLRNYVMSHQ